MKVFIISAICLFAILVVGGKYAGEYFTNHGCPYEGGECPNVQKYLQDYQVQVYYDTVWVYDYDRLVGKYVTDWTGKLDSVLLADNE
jgi:hypothetical protein